MDEMIFTFDEQGNMKTIYNENLDCNEIGNITISRASHVEPTAGGEWTADMAPSSGPILGPFMKRSEALRAEHEWLMHNM